jgi:arsenate reductase-like glutaredoxin family protein
MRELIVTKGKKVTQFKLATKDRPDDDTLAAVMLGPTGNLRAPAIRKGKKLIVGFNEEAYSEFFG